MCANIVHSRVICNSSAILEDNNMLKNGASLDTLAQLATNDEFEGENDLNLVSNTKRSDTSILLKRARRKYFSNQVVLGLVDASKLNEDSLLQKSYWNSYHCSQTLRAHADGKITGKYCNTRWCMICNAIRTAKYIKQYEPIFNSWGSPHFLTLTAITVYPHDLEPRLNVMHQIFRNILRKNSKRSDRKSSNTIDIQGVRKLECTCNHYTNKYHPHFHVICNSKETADYIMTEWLARITALGIKINSKAQDIRPATKGSCHELFKYMTKVVSKSSKHSKHVIRADKLDVIFNSMRRRRTVQPFGFKCAIDNNVQDGVTQAEVVAVLDWQHCVTDWVDVETGELLTGYSPSDGMRKLLEDGIHIS